MEAEARACVRCGTAVTGVRSPVRRAVCPECAPTLLPSRSSDSWDEPPPPEAPKAPFPSGFRLPVAGEDVAGIVIEGPLGTGGMGSVFAGRDGRLDRRVAVKFLREGYAGDEDSARRFRREGAALARIDHPHVVRIHQVGEWRGAPYLVMEHVRGRPLARLLDGGPLPLEEALRIAGELASALAAVHAARVVHRDVTPANCLLREGSGAVCLVDFGLARRLDRRTASSGRVAGTPLYMAPETVSGGEVDFRTDVYAFGVTLFEMLTGAPPFEGEEMASFFRRVLHEDAPLLRSRRPEAPRGLEVLVARSLSRFPEFRPPDGTALVGALRALRGAAADPDRVAEGAPEAAAAPPAPTPPPRDPGERLPLLGRHEEYGAALEALESSLAGRGRVLLVEGAPGAGKSRFLREVERAARARAAEILRCAAGEYAGLPYRALRAAFLEAEGAPAGGAAALLEEAARAFPERRPFVPALRWLLGEDRDAAAAAPGKEALRGAVLTLLRVSVARRPALLSVEDAHLLDEGSLEILAAAAEEARGWPLLVAASYRTADDPQRGAALEAWLPGVAGLPHATVLRMAPLAEAAVAALLHRVLRMPEVEACRLAPVLHRKSEGNPLFLSECLRVLEQEGVPGARGRGGKALRERVSTLAIPARLMELAIRRVAGLPPGERDALGVVSVDPLGVPCALVERCLEVPRLTALRTLQRLARDRGLVETKGERYAVRHAEIREAVWQDLFPELRAAYHEEAARLLLEAGAAEKEPGRVGRHLRLAGKGAEAVPHLLRDGEHLFRCFAPVEALERFEEAIVGAGRDPPVEARVGRARVLTLLGEFDAAARAFEEAAAGGSPWAILALASFERDRGRPAASLELLRRLHEEDFVPGERVRLRFLLAHALQRLGHTAEALEALDRAFEGSADADPELLLRLWSARGAVLRDAGRFPEARDASLEALRRAEALGHTQGIAVQLRNLSLVHLDLGDFEEAASWAQRAVELATVAGDGRTLAYARLDLADLRLLQLRLDEAEAILDSTADLVEGSGDAVLVSHAAARRAELLLARGDARGSLASADRGLSLRTDSPATAAGFHVLRGQALLTLGDPEEALAAARHALPAFARAGDDCGEEEAAALAARALRVLGRDGPERDRLRALDAPLTVEGAIEAAQEAEGEERRIRRERAERVAASPADREEVRKRLGAP